MPTRKTCFVVSPIGEEDSAVRAAADTFLELIIEPALEKYDFDVIRADKISRPSTITSDVIELVQQADLCIIDLSGHNPNVFYEAGRRHEAGKPFIQLISKGQNIPFDLAGIRTIEYDVSGARAIRESQLRLQSFIDDFNLRNVWAEPATGISLSSVSESLQRIESQLQRITTTNAVSAVALQTNDGNPRRSRSGGNILRDPKRAFVDALKTGDVDQLTASLVRLERLLGPTNPEVMGAAGIVVRTGEVSGFDTLRRAIADPQFFEAEEELIESCVTSVVQFASMTGKYDTVEEWLVQVCTTRAENDSVDVKDRAYYWNQLQRFYYGKDEYALALEYSNKTIALRPSEIAYQYNRAGVFRKLGDLAAAVRGARDYLNLPGVDEDHLELAVKIFVEGGSLEEAKRTFARFSERYPEDAADLLDDDDDLAAALKSRPSNE